jgi:hypothetical protein
MPYYISRPPMNPLTRLLATLLAVLALAGAFFFGIFVLAFAAGLGFLAWLFLSVRMWWMRKKGMVDGAGAGPVNGPGAGARDDRDDIIDVEYTVVSRQDEDS